MGLKGSKQDKNIKKQLQGSPQMGKKVSTGRSKKYSQEAVIVTDDRKALEEKDAIKFIGLIRAKFKSHSSCIIGTGALISEDLVLTAAHNICRINSKQFKKYKEYLQSSFVSSASFLKTSESVDETFNSTSKMSLDQTISEFKHAEYAEWIEFYPAINGELKGFRDLTQTKAKRNSEDNYHKVRQFKVHPSFITDSNNRKYDLALMQLQKPVDCKQKLRIVENYTDTKTEISVYGYPTDKCFRMDEGVVKAEQWGATGRFQVNYDTGYLNYKVSTMPGQSGSPIFINTSSNGKPQIFCIGMHTGGKEEQRTNIGLHFTEDKLQFVAETAENLTGKLSSITGMKLASLPPNSVPNLHPKDVYHKSLEEYEIEIASTEDKKLQKLAKLNIYNYRQAAVLSLQEEIYQKTIKYYEKFISAMEKLPPEQMNEDDEDEYQIALINLAKCHCQTESYLESLQLYEKAEQKCKQFFNLSVEKESTILNNKGAVLVHLGRYEQALQLFKISYIMRKNKYGEENLHCYNSLENVTSMKFKLGISLNECVQDYERVLKYKERKFGVGSREQLKTKTNLALVMFELKRYREGLDILYFCVDKYKILVEKDSSTTNKSLYSEFMKQFTSKIRDLCKNECPHDDLKYARTICLNYELVDLSRQLQTEWQRRKASQSP